MVVVKYEGSLETLSFISDAINNVLNQLKDNDEILLTHQYTFDDNNSIFIDLKDFIMIKDTTNFRTAYSYLVNTITNTLFKYIIENYTLKSSIDNDDLTYQISEGQDLYTYLSNSIKKEIAMTRDSENSSKIYDLALSDNFIKEDENSEENFIKGSIYPNNDFKHFKKIETVHSAERVTSYLQVPKEKIISNIKDLSRTKSTKKINFKDYFKSINYLSTIDGPIYSNQRFSVQDITDSYLKTLLMKSPKKDDVHLYLKDQLHQRITNFLRSKSKNKKEGQKSYSLKDVISIVGHFYLIDNHSKDLEDNTYYQLICSNHSYNSLGDVLLHKYFQDNNKQYNLFNYMSTNKNKDILNKDRSKLNNLIISLVTRYMTITHKSKTIMKPNNNFAYKILDCYFNISFTYLLEFYSCKLQLLTLKIIETNNDNDYQTPDFNTILNSLDETINKVKNISKPDSQESLDTSCNSLLKNLDSFYNLSNLDRFNHSLLMINHFSIYPNKASLN